MTATGSKNHSIEHSRVKLGLHAQGVCSSTFEAISGLQIINGKVKVPFPMNRR